MAPPEKWKIQNYPPVTNHLQSGIFTRQTSEFRLGFPARVWFYLLTSCCLLVLCVFVLRACANQTCILISERVCAFTITIHSMIVIAKRSSRLFCVFASCGKKSYVNVQNAAAFEYVYTTCVHSVCVYAIYAVRCARSMTNSTWLNRCQTIPATCHTIATQPPIRT